jgi:3-hydroxymyristoyl/3-hydroxydecanoyl-(acyl carrier protein) dehydratase
MPPPLRFSVPDSHASLAGHFPGRPIVPGVVVLDEAIALILHARPMDRVVEVIDVKFLAPVLPGHEVAVTCNEGTAGRLVFSCQVAGHAVLRGRLRIGTTG